MTFSRRTVMQMLVGATAGAASLGMPRAALATSGAAGQPAGVYRFRLGEATVTALLDGHIAIAPELVVGLDPAQADQALMAAGYPKGFQGLQIPVNGYLVEMNGRKTLIDAGAAATMGPGGGGLLPALAALGVTPAEIDEVLLTHLHLDHVAGVVDGSGAAMFPNAELVVAQSEWDFWHDEAVFASVPEENRGFFHIARTSVAPYADRMRFFTGEEEVSSGILSVPMPGHTPGHAGFQLNSGDDSLLIWGDLIHMTTLQMAHPEWTVVFDGDPALTVESRKRFLDRAAADNLLVAGMHLDFPGLGRVQRAGEAYHFQQAPWQALL